MHQNVCRMNYSNVLCMKYHFEKFQFFDRKWPIFFLSTQNASVRIRMHQNACRMNCANVLCRKISKKWFLLHFKRLKLKNYLYLFVMEDPVELFSVQIDVAYSFLARKNPPKYLLFESSQLYFG